MAELIHDIDAAKLAANLEEARALAGDRAEILVATKYVPLEEMGKLAEAGVRLVGENRQQDLAAKRERWGDVFEWDFIGNLQSRKLKLILPCCRLIHSVATDSVLAQLEKHGGPDTEVLIEVNASGEEGKGGVEPSRAAGFRRALPGPGRRPDDDAPVQSRSGGLSALFRPPRGAGSGQRIWTVSRWAPPRIGGWRSRRVRRSFASDTPFSCDFAQNLGIIRKGVGPLETERRGTDGPKRHLA